MDPCIVCYEEKDLALTLCCKNSLCTTCIRKIRAPCCCPMCRDVYIFTKMQTSTIANLGALFNEAEEKKKNEEIRYRAFIEAHDYERYIQDLVRQTVLNDFHTERRRSIEQQLLRDEQRRNEQQLLITERRRNAVARRANVNIRAAHHEAAIAESRDRSYSRRGN
jgi:hypothetical protein